MIRSLLTASLFTMLVCMSGCVYVPKMGAQVESRAFVPAPGTRIANGLQSVAHISVSDSRASLIESPHLALTSRLDLIDAADHSIDLQYFIWQNDPSGVLIIEKILSAADRGIRIRALVDDIQLQGLVNRLNALNNHPNIEIRVFNPFSVRWRYPIVIWRVAEFVIDGNRLNHRMHNKLLVADNQLAILGGRNIGDDYFGRSSKRNFIDLDVLLSGPLVHDLSAGFDEYWNSRWAFPVDELLNLSVIPDDLERVRKRIRHRLAERPTVNALSANTEFSDTLKLLADGIPIDTYVTLVDEPDVRWFDKPDEIAGELTDIIMQAEQEVLVVTPYLIPTPGLMDIARTLIDRGVTIRVVTNSLQTNDVVIAQAAASQFTGRLLEAGVEIYEFRADARLAATFESDDISLHTKYVVYDKRHIFMGSFNLDPRSLYLNTELGVVLQSPQLAEALRQSFAELTRPENSWRVLQTPDGIRRQAGDEVLRWPPSKNAWQAVRYWIYRLLPVSRQL